MDGCFHFHLGVDIHKIPISLSAQAGPCCNGKLRLKNSERGYTVCPRPVWYTCTIRMGFSWPNKSIGRIGSLIRCFDWTEKAAKIDT